MFDDLLKDSVPKVREAIAGALLRAGRRDTVRLVAVTKGQPQEAVAAALRAGLTDLGENRVQELEAKRAAYPADMQSPTWHLIGHLQRNKVKQVLPLIDLMQAVDSLRLAEALSAEAASTGRRLPVLVQVNASGETTKGGFAVATALADVTRIATLPGLRVDGLMTMAPYTDDEPLLRRTFTAVRELGEACAGVPGYGVGHLSMGMSNDFEIAVEEGSTMVRLGTILFGERASHD
jgi:PLP dependent protein